MDTSLTVRNMPRQSWALMLQDQTSSGLSVRDWCKQNNISTKTFYYRRRQVQEMVLQAASESRFAELVPPESSVPAGTSGFNPQLVLSIGNVMIGIDQDTPKQLLADTLEVIRNA